MISVEGDTGGAQLEKSDATFGGTIQSVQVRELPLNGRNIATLELLAPGATGTGQQQSSIHFAGQGIDDNNYRLDGVDAAHLDHLHLLARAGRIVDEIKELPGDNLKAWLSTTRMAAWM